MDSEILRAFSTVESNPSECAEKCGVAWDTICDVKEFIGKPRSWSVKQRVFAALYLGRKYPSHPSPLNLQYLCTH